MIHALEKFIGQLKRGRSKLNNAKWFMTNVPWACSKRKYFRNSRKENMLLDLVNL